jgi:Anaphase-promoting complex, cyclosome, subunit 3
MLGSQLLELVKSLDKRDMRELRKVVRSPYFNQRDDVSQLFDCIDKTLNSRLPDLSKEKIFEKVYHNQKYDDVLIRQLMSYLYKVIQKYLITEGVLQNEMESQLYLTHALRQRNADRIVEKQLNDSLEIIEKQGFKNAKYHYIKYSLRIEDYEYKSKKKRTSEMNLQNLSDELDFYYLSERLRQACIMYSHETISKHTYEQPFLSIVLAQLHNMQEIPLSVLAYFHTYKALTTTDNQEHFKKLRDIILEQGYLFPENERRDLYIHATNYCIRRLNQGEKAYGTQALELYRARLDNEVLLENDILPAFTYKNILMLALKSEEYEWAEKFLYDFKQYLPEKERENIFQYNLALFYFRTGKYSEAMDLLQKVNLNDVLYNLDARRLLARIYYDLDEINALQSLIESSKVYLHRQKGIGYHHDMYTNFFRFLEKMMKMDMKKAEARLILRGEVEGTQLLAEREWLLQKLS